MAKSKEFYDRITSAFFMAVGLFFALYARSVEIGTFNEPGPGFVPFWAGLTLIIMSIALFLQTLRKSGVMMPPFFPLPDSWQRVTAVFISMAVYAGALNWIGFTVTTFIFVFCLVKFIFPQSWTRSLITATLSAVGARLLFVDFLKTQLPPGILGF